MKISSQWKYASFNWNQVHSQSRCLFAVDIKSSRFTSGWQKRQTLSKNHIIMFNGFRWLIFPLSLLFLHMKKNGLKRFFLAVGILCQEKIEFEALINYFVITILLQNLSDKALTWKCLRRKSRKIIRSKEWKIRMTFLWQT